MKIRNLFDTTHHLNIITWYILMGDCKGFYLLHHSIALRTLLLSLLNIRIAHFVLDSCGYSKTLIKDHLIIKSTVKTTYTTTNTTVRYLHA